VGSLATAGDQLSNDYEVEQTVVRRDLEALVSDLLKAGLLKAA